MLDEIALNLTLISVAVGTYIYWSADPHVSPLQKLLAGFFWTVTLLPIPLLAIEARFLSTDVSLQERDSLIYRLLWELYYFVNLINGAVVIPCAIRYHLSGEFTVREKLRDTLQSRLWLLLAVVSCCLALVILFKYQFELDILPSPFSLPKILNSFFYLVFSFLVSYGMIKAPLHYLWAKPVHKIEEGLATFEDTLPAHRQYLLTLQEFQAVPSIGIRQAGRKMR